ncbi:leucine-rich repeat domain-containing protein [Thioclava sp. GXIMD4216]|uniref:leucine-rich repeat domain-containing protein n=1 Tax=Thioclava sp. GXIMD4216 TaxID=3131929 RepID=UPI0030D3946E
MSRRTCATHPLQTSEMRDETEVGASKPITVEIGSNGSLGIQLVDTASRIGQTIDALKDADPNVFHSNKSTVDEPAPTCTGWHLQGRLPESDKTYTQIKRLFLQDCSKLRTLTWVKNFPNLEKLWIYGSDKIADLEGIQAAKYLSSVTVWPSFSGKITLKSLSPIGALKGLEEFIYAGGTRDGSLEALNSLQNLKKTFFSNAYSWQEIARFEAHHPEAAFPWKGGIVPSANPGLLMCKKCGTAQSMLAGKGLRLACPACDSAYIEKHLERYTLLLST